LSAAIWLRGAPADYDHWAYLGNAGWGWADVEAVFERIEDRGGGGSGTPTGPLRVTSGNTYAPSVMIGERAADFVAAGA
jgi:choline dehydrogenase